MLIHKFGLTIRRGYFIGVCWMLFVDWKVFWLSINCTATWKYQISNIVFFHALKLNNFLKIRIFKSSHSKFTSNRVIVPIKLFLKYLSGSWTDSPTFFAAAKCKTAKTSFFLKISFNAGLSQMSTWHVWILAEVIFSTLLMHSLNKIEIKIFN